MDNNQAVVAAARYVLDNDVLFDAAFDANRDRVQGATREQARQALRDGLAEYPRDSQGYGAVAMAARFLAGNDRFLQRAVDAAVAAGTLDRGTTVGQAGQFLRAALGAPAQAAAAPVRDQVREQARPQLAAQDGQENIRIVLEVPRDIARELLGL
jgi:hypothetical protein